MISPPLLGCGPQLRVFMQNQTSHSVCRAPRKMKMWGPLFKNSEFQDSGSRALNEAYGFLSTNAVWLHRSHAQEGGVRDDLDMSLKKKKRHLLYADIYSEDRSPLRMQISGPSGCRTLRLLPKLLSDEGWPTGPWPLLCWHKWEFCEDD